MFKLVGRTIAAAMIIAAANAWAAGAFDGTWVGGASQGSAGCHIIIATATIADGQVTGNLRHHTGTSPLSGTIAADGTFAGTAGSAKLKGMFSGDQFDGTYESSECGVRKFTLSRAHN